MANEEWVVNRWSGERIAPVVLFGAADAERVARASEAAFRKTKLLPSYERARILHETARLIAASREEFVSLITREAGKPKKFASVEVDRAIATFTLGAEEASRIGGEVIPLDLGPASASHRGSWRRVPRGPVLAITPFNFPLNLVAHKVAPALACGASVVLKPAPQTPLTALKLAEIVTAAGAPLDMLQVMPCTNDVAELLVRHEAFGVVSFTGSDKVGWHLKSIAGRKHVMLELGGNAACIVHDDGLASDLARRVASSAFNYAGQVCIKTQRLYVQRSVADAFVNELVEQARLFVPSDPEDVTTTIGPMIDERSAIRVATWIDEALASGAQALVPAERSGNRLSAAILLIEGEGRGLRVVEEEAFGPVLTVHRYDTWGEALSMVNRTRYGLQAGIFTDSMSRIHEAYDELDLGALIVGDVPSMRVDAMPYGGRRDSGIGREGVRYAIEEMTDRQLLVMSHARR